MSMIRTPRDFYPWDADTVSIHAGRETTSGVGEPQLYFAEMFSGWNNGERHNRSRWSQNRARTSSVRKP